MLPAAWSWAGAEWGWEAGNRLGLGLGLGMGLALGLALGCTCHAAGGRRPVGSCQHPALSRKPSWLVRGRMSCAVPQELRPCPAAGSCCGRLCVGPGIWDLSTLRSEPCGRELWRDRASAAQRCCGSSKRGPRRYVPPCQLRNSGWFLSGHLFFPYLTAFCSNVLMQLLPAAAEALWKLI